MADSDAAPSTHPLLRRLSAAAREGIAANLRRFFLFAGIKVGEWTEFQALEVRNDRWPKNYYAHAAGIEQSIQLVTEADAWNATGVYVILNRIEPAVVTRAETGRWQVAEKGGSTTDSEIIARRLLFLDFDWQRPKKTSATRDQVRAALTVMVSVYERLAELLDGEDALAAGMSGNGGSILIALDDLAPSDEVTLLVRTAIVAVGVKYATAKVDVDQSVSDLKRLGPAWGSWKKKGAKGVAERPHRQTGLVIADQVRRLTLHELERLVERLLGDLDVTQRGQVDRALGKKATSAKPKGPTSASAAGPGAEHDVFARARQCSVYEVLVHCGLLDEDDVTCPGCGLIGTRADTSVAVVGNGVKCSHNRCSTKGKNGYFNPVDIVAVHFGLSPIDAVRRLGELFHFEVPEQRKGEDQGGGGGFVGFDGAHPDAWPDFQPLPDTLLPVAPLDLAIVPAPFRPWINDVAYRLQAPPDFVAVNAIVAFGSVIGRAVAVRPKARDNWQVVANLWGGMVAEAGFHKSPSQKAALVCLHLLEAEARAAHEKAVEQTTAEDAISEAKKKDLKKRLADAVKATSGRGPGRLRVVKDSDDSEPAEDPKVLAAELAALEKQGAPPTLRRFIVNDPSVEKLGELLNENDRGLLLSRDELVGFLYKLEQEGHEADKAFYLESWNGNGLPYTYDRIARGTVRIEAPCVSVLGGVQPGPLMAYVRAIWKSGAGEDGFVQRFQLLVWPDMPPEVKYVDEWPDTEARNRAFAIFKAGAEAGLAASVGAAPDPYDTDRIPYLHFDPEAQPLFDRWCEAVIGRARSPEDHPAVRSHLAKLPSLMPSLALIFHVIAVLDGSARSGPIGVEAASLAIAWTEYLETHARRIYAAISRRRQIAGALLGQKLLAGKLADGFTARDVTLKGWAGLNDPEDIKLAFEELVDLGWLRPVESKREPGQGGRPTVRYLVHPQVRGGR